MLEHRNQWDPDIAEAMGLNPEIVESLDHLPDEFHDSFSDCFNHKAQKEHGLIYLKGLLSNIERKSLEPIALEFIGEKGVRTLQHFFQKGKWDEKKMHQIYLRTLSPYISSEDAMKTIDGSGCSKKGKESVGVKRQYCGSLGKVENCQVGVFLGYTSSKGYGLLDTQLYLPEEWHTDEYAERRRKCEVPEDLGFLTKPQIALHLLEKNEQFDLFPAKWLGCDSEFGSNHEFLDSISDKYYYFADQKSDTKVWLEEPEVKIPPYKGRGPYPKKPQPSEDPMSLKELAKDPSLSWEKVVLGEGSKGPIIADVACERIITSRNNLPHQEEWLYVRKMENNEVKFSTSNAPADIPKKELDEAALMRWPIEQSFRIGKDYLGMDEYELRSWIGWHRHMLYVFLAMLLLIIAQWLFEIDDKPAITIPQAKRLIKASFSKKKGEIVKIINQVLYYLRRNYAAYLSHRKKKLVLLNAHHL